MDCFVRTWHPMLKWGIRMIANSSTFHPHPGRVTGICFVCCMLYSMPSRVWSQFLGRLKSGVALPWFLYSTTMLIVRGPEVEPGKWVQSFFLNVFILYRYCSLWNRVMAFSQHWAFLNNAFYIFSHIAVQNSGLRWSGKTENPGIYSHNW